MEKEFYEISAQVLPVVFLAAAVEFRLLEPPEEEVTETPPGERWAWLAGNLVIVIGFVVTVSIGEFSALRAVAEAEASPAADRLIIGSLAVSGVLILLTPVMNMLLRLERATRADRPTAEGPSGRAYDWATAIAAVIALAVLVTPTYGLLVMTGVLD